MSRRAALAAVLGGVALAAAVIAAFAVGRYPIEPGELAAVLWAKLTGGSHGVPATIETVILGVRGPRVLAALAIGAALAAAGAAYQALFRNPLVSPDILGVSAGAAVGAVVGIFLSLPVPTIQLLAFVGGLAAVSLVYAVAGAVRGHDPLLVLVLAGVVIGALGGAVIALVKYVRSGCSAAWRPRPRATSPPRCPRYWSAWCRCSCCAGA